jgi:hypothetical protein
LPKKIIGSQNQVEWRRCQPGSRGGIAHIVVRANHIPDGLAAAEYKAESANFMNALNASNANRAESKRHLQLVTLAIGNVLHNTYSSERVALAMK